MIKKYVTIQNPRKIFSSFKKSIIRTYEILEKTLIYAQIFSNNEINNHEEREYHSCMIPVCFRILINPKLFKTF